MNLELTSCWYAISLRPRGQHSTLRREVEKQGGRLIAVSPWALQYRTDAVTQAQLALALAGELQLFTSPVAVAAAGKLQSLCNVQAAVAVGEGTVRTLYQHGIRHVYCPQRMDSEGVLALPIMHHLAGKRVGLITAPGGRNLITEEVQRRGAELLRVDVYQRQPIRLRTATLKRLQTLTDDPTVLLLSSVQALQQVLPQLPVDIRHRWQQQPVIAASARLAHLAAEQGFVRIYTAQGPLPAQLVHSAYAALSSA